MNITVRVSGESGLLLSGLTRSVMSGSNIIHTEIYSSPCGDLLLGSMDGRLCLCDWAAKPKRAETDAVLKRLSGADYVVAPSETTRMAAVQLDEYFARRRMSFDVPLLLFGTEFRRMVWEALLGIPYGVAVSYRDMAERVGRRSAVRAVAAAVGANPVSIFVPCHRVIGSDGRLVGYAGGMEAKRMMLELEKSAGAVMR